MAQTPSTPRYRIYLLTIWAERSRDSEVPVQWRFSLKHPATGRRRGFANLAALVAALQQATTGEANLAGEEDQADP